MLGPTRPNRELVVYALFLLGGDSHSVHTEDIALKSFSLAPDAFSWVRHPQYPDKDIVRVALTDARKAQHGALVEGRAGQRRGLPAKTLREPVEDGWTLTQRGVEWIRDNLVELEQIGDSQVVKEHRQKLLRDLKRIRGHRLFSRYEEDPDAFEPTIGEIADLMRCRVDADPEVWRGRFERALGQAAAAEQPDVASFIEKCRATVLQ